MAKRIIGTTPKEDGFRMPGEFEAQDQIFMIWPERPDNWRDGAKPVQIAFTNVAKAISRFTPVTMLVSQSQYQNARYQLPADVRVLEVSNNDSWVRDCGPSFVINDKGELRANDWTFNAWGGLVDGLYFPWDQDDLVAQKVCELERVDSYRTDDFVLEGGSFHVDGQGTVLTTEMCLLSEGRNPHMSKEDIEHTRQTFSKAANSKAWKESYGEMCKKTVLRRLCKLIDLNFDTAEQCQAFEDGSAFDVKEKPKEKYQAQDIYQSHDQSSHNADESSDGVIDGTFKEVDE